ncbi:nucleoside monophosphate kinase [Candidatus Pacearchaeota archaeon]|nr:nucleoside monophosphate kinase [Candidatus Pacearchaeota archaeon]
MKIILLGAPGAGKGTYAKRLKEQYDLSHISTGDLLRNAVANDHPKGAEVKELMESGKFVSDELIVELLKDSLETSNGRIILDGFPRTTNQAELLKEIAEINAVLKFDIEEETILRRLANRLTCEGCGEIFHSVNIKPKVEGICDKCESKLYTRDDDQEETILKRLETYRQQTAPLEDYYKNLGILKNIDANLDMSHPDVRIIEDCQEILDEIQRNL